MENAWKRNMGKKQLEEHKRKISKGLKRSYQNGRKPIRLLGNKNPNWKGGKQRDRHKGDGRYIAWRKSVFERDNFICQVCLRRGIFLNAHHIKYWSECKELRYELSNGITLCRTCHKLVHRGIIELLHTRLLGLGVRI